MPEKRRTRDRGVVDRLAALEAGDPVAAAGVMIAAAGTSGVASATLAARVTRPLSELAGALAAVEGVVPLGQGPVAYLSREAVGDLSRQLLARLESFHEQQPLKSVMSREELRARIFARAPAGAFEHVLDNETRAGTIRTVADGVALVSHAVRLSPEETAVREALLEGVRSAGLKGFELARATGSVGKDPRLLQRVAHVLQAEGRIKRVGEALLVDGETLVSLADQVRSRWPPGSRLDVAGFKELTGLSRKYVIPLLEYLDREKVTRRSGSDRVVLPSGVS
jgi:selenocysteine-specific elongation factor